MAPRLSRWEALAVLALLLIAQLCAWAFLRPKRRRTRKPRKDPSMSESSILNPAAEGLVDATQVVSSLADAVQAHPAVPAAEAASVITRILASLAQAQPAIFAVSRASARTQAEVSLGLGLAEVIVGALLKRPR
jgi:hypothetical protein